MLFVMHARSHISPELSSLADAQSGVLSREQCLALGLSRHSVQRIVGSGAFQPMCPGVYFSFGGQPDWLAHVWAATLLGGDDSRVAGLTAARLHGLVDEDSLPVDLLVPANRKSPGNEWCVVRRERRGVRSPSVGSPSRLRIEETVLDLCARGGSDEVVNWITRAVQRRLTTPHRLTGALATRTRLPHRRAIEAVIGSASQGVHSPLEHRYRTDVEKVHGLPRAQRQFAVPGTGRRADVAHKEYGVLIELDGRIGHVDEGMWRDRARDNAHALTGWTTLRFGWWEVSNDPCGVARQVAAVLRARGWISDLTSCQLCVR